jgi:hypothetical protein
MFVHEILPLGGGDTPVPACVTVTEFDPFAPFTVYTYCRLDDDVLAGNESCQLVLLPPDADLPPFQEFTVPQFAVSVTVPPAAGSEVGDADTEHEVVPVEQSIVMLPALSTTGAEQLDTAVPLIVIV